LIEQVDANWCIAKNDVIQPLTITTPAIPPISKSELEWAQMQIEAIHPG
jgi:hypothetical protein